MSDSALSLSIRSLRSFMHDRLAAGSGGTRDREAYFAAAYELLSDGVARR